MHAQLVRHLESLVADGTIDPDRLVTGDLAALAAMRQLQSSWLTTALPDGRIPRQAIEDESDDAFFAAWDDAERDAREILGSILSEVGERPCPSDELAAAAARLREELRQDRRGTAQLRAASGLDPTALPTDDAELWLTLAAGVVAQRDEPPQDEFDLETLSAWAALQHPDWIALAVTLAREGPGTEVDIDRLASLIAEFDFEASDDDESDEAIVDEVDAVWFGDDLGEDSDAALSISLGLYPVLRLWRQLGAVDHNDRLTQLGWWGIPESLDLAWQPAAADNDH